MFDAPVYAAPARPVLAGEPLRDAAAAVAFDRIVGDCLEREWIIGPQPQTNKARHGRKTVPPVPVDREAHAC